MKYVVSRMTTDANNAVTQTLVSNYDGTPEGRFSNKSFMSLSQKRLRSNG